MGKKSAQKKRKLAHAVAPLRATTPLSLDDQLVPHEDLAVALDVLDTLREHPEELSEKYTKDLKRGVFDLHRIIAEGATLGVSRGPYL